MRVRRILRRGLYGGRACAHVREMQPCHYPPCYTWRIAAPGACVHKYADMQCGQGLTNRTAQCVGMNNVSVTVSQGGAALAVAA